MSINDFDHDVEYVCEFIKNAGELIIECITFAMLDCKHDKNATILGSLNEGLLAWDCKLIKKKSESFDCYAYPGICIRVTEEICKNCDMGPKGCPAYNPEWLKKDGGEIWAITPNLGALRVR